MAAKIIQGDCLEVLRGMDAESVDSIVTDPPYGLSFMGKRWDHDVPSIDIWSECLRVLKPGGHLLAFGGSRTYHRLAVAIEDAGFEIRDQIMWLYGSGFPKSLDVSKAIDKAAGAERTERLAPKPGHEKFVGRDNVKSLRESGALSGEGGYSRPWMYDPQKVENAHWDFAPATEAARQWQGWGTALKPAHEPICMARKPLAKGRTVAANVLAHGVGALNIDGCRVPAEKQTGWGGKGAGGNTWNETNNGLGKDGAPRPVDGRWPANVIHDGSDEVVALFPQSNGSAARFFYCAKASKTDRGEGNNHPTVKPTDLMAYLCRLVTPPGGVVLDPFMGSGSTGKAAIREGFGFIGIELDPEYAAIARARLGSVPVAAAE